MQNRIKHIEIRVAYLKTLYILRQASGGNFSVGSADTRVLHIANLNHIFVEALALVGRCHHALRNLVLEDMLIVACVYLPVGSLLLCIVTLDSSSEQAFVGFLNRLLREKYIVLCPGVVHIFGIEFTVVVGKAALSLTMREAFFTHR